MRLMICSTQDRKWKSGFLILKRKLTKNFVLNTHNALLELTQMTKSFLLNSWRLTTKITLSVLQVTKLQTPPLSKRLMSEWRSVQDLTLPSQELEFCFGEMMASSQLRASSFKVKVFTKQCASSYNLRWPSTLLPSSSLCSALLSMVRVLWVGSRSCGLTSSWTASGLLLSKRKKWWHLPLLRKSHSKYQWESLHPIWQETFSGGHSTRSLSPFSSFTVQNLFSASSSTMMTHSTGIKTTWTGR